MAMKDFDAFIKENNKQPIPFKLFGKKWELASTMPALIMIQILRGKKEDEIDPTLVLDMMEALVGKDQFEEMLKLGLDIDTMEELVTWATSQYSHKLDKSKAAQDNANFLTKKSV